MGIEAVSEAGQRRGGEVRWNPGEIGDRSGTDRERLAALSRRMERIGPPNEAILESLLAALGEPSEIAPAAHWLTAARLFELGLACLGEYVDACEFTAAGDLLANPRRVDVYVRGESSPRAKRRHRSLAESVEGGRCRADAMGWLRRNACVRVTKPALLPELFVRLRRSGWLAEDYLESGDRRMKRAASAMAFLWASRWDAASLRRRLRVSAPAERRWLESRLCRFDRDRFDAMGRELDRFYRLDGEPANFGRFLRRPPVRGAGVASG